MDSDPPYHCRVTVYGDAGDDIANYQVRFDHEAPALALFDFIVQHVSINFNAVRRAAQEAKCPTDQPPSS